MQYTKLATMLAEIERCSQRAWIAPAGAKDKVEPSTAPAAWPSTPGAPRASPTTSTSLPRIRQPLQRSNAVCSSGAAPHHQQPLIHPPPLHTPSATMAGFDFSNHNRNAALHAQGVPLPKATSTGTTIVGALFDGGVVIAADTRATSGPIVADKVRPAALRFQLQAVVFGHDPSTDAPRTARSCTTSPRTSGAQALVPPPTPSSPRPSSRRTSSCTPSAPAASRASSQP